MVATILWAVYVELDDANATEQRCRALQQRILHARPNSGASVGIEHRRQNHVSVQLAIEASTPRRAVEIALGATTKAAHEARLTADVVGYSVTTWAQFERELVQPLIPELVAYPEIGDILGVSRQRARQLAEEHPDFPPAAVETSGARGVKLYVRRAIEDFADLERKPGQHAKPAD